MLTGQVISYQLSVIRYNLSVINYPLFLSNRVLVNNINHQISSLAPGLSKGLVGHYAGVIASSRIKIVIYLITLIYKKECQIDTHD